MRIACGVEYHGSRFRGWQFQPGQRTVQTTLEKAISTVANHPVTIHAAGRTDAGVHALNQVIHFDTQAERDTRSWLLGVNANLPTDVNINWATPVADEFNARFSAEKRYYRYLILNRLSRSSIHHQRMWWFYKTLDTDLMQKAAHSLLGHHDFSAFRAKDCQAKSPMKTLDKIDIHKQGDVIAIDVEAKSFLHHMVRNIVGVLVPIGEGKYPVSWAQAVLESGRRERGGMTAPADGLYLTDVRYPEHYQLPGVSAFPVLW